MDREFVHRALRFYIDNYEDGNGYGVDASYEEFEDDFDHSFVERGGNPWWPVAYDADGKPVRLGDEMVWRNPNNDGGEYDDEDEEFTMRGFITEGGHDGDVFLVGENFDRHFLGWCYHKEA